MSFRLLVLLLLAALSTATVAADVEFTLLILGHRFQPEQLNVPAGKKIRLTVENRDLTPEEFESFVLNREKVIGGNSKATIYIGPLDPGSYPFIGEFNQTTARGTVVAE